jgi:hypothetical protein
MNYKHFLFVFTVALTISSSTVLSMEEDNLDVEEEIIYKIKNKGSEKFLYHNNHTIKMSTEENIQNNYANNIHWKIEKNSDCFMLKKSKGEEFLFLCDIGVSGVPFMEDRLENDNDDYTPCYWWNLGIPSKSEGSLIFV